VFERIPTQLGGVDGPGHNRLDVLLVEQHWQSGDVFALLLVEFNNGPDLSRRPIALCRADGRVLKRPPLCFKLRREPPDLLA
jgi:hypothetical protein